MVKMWPHAWSWGCELPDTGVFIALAWETGPSRRMHLGDVLWGKIEVSFCLLLARPQEHVYYRGRQIKLWKLGYIREISEESNRVNMMVQQETNQQRVTYISQVTVEFGRYFRVALCWAGARAWLSWFGHSWLPMRYKRAPLQWTEHDFQTVPLVITEKCLLPPYLPLVDSLGPHYFWLMKARFVWEHRIWLLSFLLEPC